MQVQPKSITLDLNYSPFELFEMLHHEPGSILLESTMQNSDYGNKSLIVTNPISIILIKNNQFFEEINSQLFKIDQNPLDYLRKLINRYQTDSTSEYFAGGFVGYFSYDFGCSFESVKLTKPRSTFLPDIFFGVYEWGLNYDHYKEEWKISGIGNINTAAENILVQFKNKSANYSQRSVEVHNERNKIQSNVSRNDYLSTIKRVKEYIAAGDIYQVNLSQQFSGDTNISPLVLYERLREMNPAPFSALMCINENDWVLSSSPELFLDLQRKNVETRPIKGTIRRGKTPEEDEKLKRELFNSPKDNAELLMIIDLERNDLNRVCKTGSVIVPDLKMVETYASVHHLVARICGELRDDRNVIDLLMSTFPGGSITGAPKIRAMQIIDELEPNRRGIYTGAIGYIDFNKSAKFNIAIRTMTYESGKVTVGVGGGIVADSDPGKEFQETLDKAAAMFKALGVEVK